jgi:type VI secretion system protein ImpL
MREILSYWRIPTVVLGLLCFGLVIWYVGPIIGIGDTYPLDPVWIRVTIIAVAVFVVLLVYAIRYWRKRRAARAIETALKTDDAATGDGEVLAGRMAEALETLKRSSGKQTFPTSFPGTSSSARPAPARRRRSSIRG